MPTSTLLPLLADGEFRSGQALADALGVSRTAVWKQLTKLAEESGIVIERVRGRGYRIPGGLDLLQRDAIEQRLSPAAAALLADLQLLDNVDSTNAHLLRAAEQGAQRGLACATERQSAGRGRHGRQWVSPYACNIYLSLLWRFDQGAAALEGLSLAVGVAVARALAASAVSGISLKWPNDILHKGAKLGGILLEMSGDAAGPCAVVVGVGLNVAMPAAAASAIDQDWTDVATVTGDGAPGRNALTAALLNELLPLLAGFAEGGFASWRQQWQALDAFADARVVMSAGSVKLAGVARGVDERGALLLETSGGIQPVYGGEMSLRGDSQ
ncbi:MAG: bifunctional biotin--[acetyl-CoA-carboxylase] ligase/biotin operon repressor BirA [Halioglobus sp.]|nr:bifunctional biotin--[acetyl-CoA-carboxylase] ligase/biotin operon repressor BirA [Halioglobus sp.]